MGGFSGRSNKLVDGCYSFWQGSIFHMINEDPEADLLYKESQLQKYIFFCTQSEMENERGGLRDKPGKRTDIYHTMYGLVGLALTH